jgi:hypothetical protein
MSLTLEEIHAEALSLPEESRAELVERLMATLVKIPDPEVEQTWFEEAERRRQQLLDGSVQGNSGGGGIRQIERLVKVALPA